MTARKISNTLVNSFDYSQGLVIRNIFIGHFEMDVVRVSKDGYVYEYEVKTSVADFCKDFDKSVAIGDVDPVCVDKHFLLSSGNYPVNRFYYTMPMDVYKRVKVPEYAGVIVYNKGTVSYVKPAPFINHIKHNHTNAFLYKMMSREINLNNKIYDLEQKLAISNHNVRVLSAAVDINSHSYYIHKNDPDANTKYKEFKRLTQSSKQKEAINSKREVYCNFRKAIAGEDTYNKIRELYDRIVYCNKLAHDFVIKNGYSDFKKTVGALGGGVHALKVEYSIGQLPPDWRWVVKKEQLAIPRSSSERYKDFMAELTSLPIVTYENFFELLGFDRYSNVVIYISDDVILVSTENVDDIPVLPIDLIRITNIQLEEIVKGRKFTEIRRK